MFGVPVSEVKKMISGTRDIPLDMKEKILSLLIEAVHFQSAGRTIDAGWLRSYWLLHVKIKETRLYPREGPKFFVQNPQYHIESL